MLDAASLTIEGVLLVEDSMVESLTFVKHASLPENLIQERLSVPGSFARPSIPVRQQRTQSPNPAIYHDLPPNLRLKLGEYIGHGRSGVVFKVNLEGLASNAPHEMLPPLVAKFGRQHYNKWLLREAWFYEEMQSIQGVAIPWCYGLYTARIPVVSGRVFLPWIEGWKRRAYGKDNRIGLDGLVRDYEGSDGKDASDVKNLESEKDLLREFGDFSEQYGDLVKEVEDESNSQQRSTVITVLILEELGEPYLPEGGKNWPMKKSIPEHITKDVYDAYDKLSELGIIHMDIKHENILKAPVRVRASLPASDKARSDEVEFSEPGQSYTVDATAIRCRIIDFELSKKSNFTREVLNRGAKSYLEDLIATVRSGDPIGQHVNE